MKILKTKYPTAFSFDGCVVVSLLLKKNKLFSLEANYFTILWWFFPYIEMNQPCEPGFEINTGTYILMCTSEVVELARSSFESQECFIYIYMYILRKGERKRWGEKGREGRRGRFTIRNWFLFTGAGKFHNLPSGNWRLRKGDVVLVWVQRPENQENRRYKFQSKLEGRCKS